VANISQKVDGNLYVDEDFSAVEFVEQDSGVFRLLGTTLSNWVMPFLRFDIGDLIEGVSEPPPGNRSGRHVMRIWGREGDYILLRDGTRVGEAACSLFFKEVPSILKAQMIQSEIGSLNIRVVVNESYSLEDEAKLKHLVGRTLGRDLAGYC